MRKVFAAMHNVTESLGFRDVELDFTRCSRAFAGPMLSLAALAQNYLANGVDFDLILPEEQKLRRLFLNTNWAHMIDFRQYDPSHYRGSKQIPAIKYTSGTDQHLAVERIMDKILGALEDFDR
ncbi:MAG: hypothetical protein ACREEE_13295, partial [Dongiaceae bacterium]